MKLNVTGNDTGPYICRSFAVRGSRREDGNTTTCLNGCMASWQSVHGEVTRITTQGCWTGNYEQINCSEDRCLSGHHRVHKNLMHVDLNYCCCRGNLCNTMLYSYERKQQQPPVSTTSYNLLPTTSTHSHDEPFTINNISKSLQTSPIVLASVGILVSLVILLGICIIKRRDVVKKRLMKVKYATRSKTSKTPSGSHEKEEEMLSKREISNLKQNTKQFDAIEVDTRAVLNQSRFGTIYLAKVRIDQREAYACYKAENQSVMTSRKHAALNNEAELLRYLSSFNFANVATFIAQYDHHTMLSGFLMEYCEMGSLRHYLDGNFVNFKTCMNLIRDLSSAVSFLHLSVDHAKVAIAHRDISSGNCLLRANMTLVISDFGFAVRLSKHTDGPNPDNLAQLTAAGTPFYVAPEILQLTVNLHNIEAALKQADVYSMSLVMWEITERCTDFHEGSIPPPHYLPFQQNVATTQQLLHYVCVDKKRPHFSFLQPKTAIHHCSEDETKSVMTSKMKYQRDIVCQTIEECWDQDEDSRLSSSTAYDRIVDLMLD